MGSEKVERLARRLTDARGKKVVFLSHCLLNENTRYLGGACCNGCVRGVVDACADRGLGMVQLPCPEQEVWGGVLKRRMLRLYGEAKSSPLAGRLVRAVLPLAMRYVRLRYRALARAAAAKIQDYVSSGFRVVAFVGIDGSPSCGVSKTLDVDGFVAEMLGVDPESLSVGAQNEMVRRHVTAGRGIFVEELDRELRARGVRVPFLAHDLIAELDGRPSSFTLPDEA